MVGACGATYCNALLKIAALAESARTASTARTSMSWSTLSLNRFNAEAAVRTSSSTASAPGAVSISALKSSQPSSGRSVGAALGRGAHEGQTIDSPACAGLLDDLGYQTLKCLSGGAGTGRDDVRAPDTFLDCLLLLTAGVSEADQGENDRSQILWAWFVQDPEGVADKPVSPEWQGAHHAVVDEIQSQTWTHGHDASEAFACILIDGLD